MAARISFLIFPALFLALTLLPRAALSEVTGTIEHVRIDRSTHSKPDLRIQIRTQDAQVFEIPSSLAEKFPPRTRVRFNPEIFQRVSEMTIRSLQDNLTVEAQPADLSNSLHRVLVLLVNFNDASVNCSTKKLDSILHKAKKNVQDWILETTFQQVRFDFDSDQDGKADIATVAIDAESKSSCNYTDWSSAADAAATAAGINLSTYEHIAYIFPESIACDWGGLGLLDCGESCQIWLQSCTNKALYSHEFGHNLGLDHATYDTTGDYEGDSEYGDLSCPMGSADAGIKHFNAPHKAHLNLIPDELVIKYEEDTHIKLTASEVAPSDINTSDFESPLSAHGQLVRLPVPGSKVGLIVLDHYFASLRKKKGKYSKHLASAYNHAITIHKKRVLSGKTTQIANLQKPGQSFSSKEDDTIITYLDRSGSEAVLWISQEGQAAPEFELSGTILASSGKPLAEDELQEIYLSLKKKFTSENFTVYPDADGNFSFQGSYGTYIARLRFPKKKYSVSYSLKKRKVLLTEGTSALLYEIKRK